MLRPGGKIAHGGGSSRALYLLPAFLWQRKRGRKEDISEGVKWPLKQWSPEPRCACDSGGSDRGGGTGQKLRGTNDPEPNKEHPRTFCNTADKLQKRQPTTILSEKRPTGGKRRKTIRRASKHFLCLANSHPAFFFSRACGKWAELGGVRGTTAERPFESRAWRVIFLRAGHKVHLKAPCRIYILCTTASMPTRTVACQLCRINRVWKS